MKHISSRALRFIALLMLTVFGTAFANAQYYINVWKKDGTRTQYAVPDVNQVTFNSFKLSDFNPEYVDLGLSVKWATCNLGSMKAYQLGDYFEWGSPKDLGQMTQHSWYDSSTKKFTKYVVSMDEGPLDMRYRLQLEDDAAYAAGGAGWRMPTDKECRELVDSCIWTRMDSCGVPGYLVSSKKNSNSIFLPFTGFVEDNDTTGVNTYGYYMTNTLSFNYQSSNCVLLFDNNGKMPHAASRFRAIQVRPVYTSESYEDMVRISNLSFDKSSYDIETGQFITIKATYDKNIEDLNYREFWSSSDSTVASVSIGGEVYGVSAGVSYITVTVGNVSKSCVVYVSSARVVKESVDMGVSVKWATCNVGASKPEYFGNYYAWGETEIKSEYNWQNYKWAQGKDSTFTKYCSDSDYGYNGFEDDLTTLQPDDDAVRKAWGGDWRMPTIADYIELLDSCNKSIVERNGRRLLKLTSKVTGDSIFFPYSGYYGSVHFNSGEVMTMTSDAHPQSGASPAIAMIAERYDAVITAPRYLGFNVRPVKPYDANEGITSVCFDLDKVDLLQGDSFEMTLMGTRRGTKLIPVVGATWESDNPAVATVSNGVIVAKAAGTCTVTATANGHTASCAIEVYDGTPQAVDLGLSVKWATFNIGAYMPQMAGDYYAWGAIDTTHTYLLENYRFFEGYNGYYQTYSKYVRSSYFGNIDGKRVLDMEDDVANVKWSNGWRIPKVEYFQELFDSCSWVLTDSCGVNGYLVTSNVKGFEANSIFLPFAGYTEDDLYYLDYAGSYWTSSLDNYYSNEATSVDISSYDVDFENCYRYYGFSIRPVIPFSVSDVNSIKFAGETLKLRLNSICKPEIIPYDSNGRSLFVDDLTVTWKSDNPAVAVVDKNGAVNAVGAGTCKLIASLGSSSDTCEVVVIDPTTFTVESVDLGLSVKWSPVNLGAFSPEMPGDYYAWGDLEPYYVDGARTDDILWKKGKESGYCWETYFDTDDNGQTFIKYNGERLYLAPEDDAATYEWGPSWRIPTDEEFRELTSFCDWTFTDSLGMKGFLVTSKVEGFEDKSLFMPLAGYYDDTDICSVNSDAYYWSSTTITSSPNSVSDLCVFYGNIYVGSDSKYYGQSYRPVQLFDISSVDSLLITLPDSIVIDERIDLSMFVCGKIGERMVKVQLSAGTWSSSNVDVLRIENGEAIGLSEGEAVVTLTAGTTVKTARIKVKAASPSVAPPKPLPGPYVQ